MSRVERLRRGVVIAAGGAAALGGAAAIGMTHGHRWLAFALMAAAAVLLFAALLVLMERGTGLRE